MRSGDAELRPDGHAHAAGSTDFELPTTLGRASRSRSASPSSCAASAAGGVVALYPSPAGATECELDLEAWDELVAANPVLDDLEPDVEALIVNRIADPPQLRHRADRPLLRAGRA